MATKIQLTPAELKAQAAEMNALKADYEALFSGVSATLKKVNVNWSSNLSRNFEGKITSAQNAFKGMAEKLSQGAKIAIASANTFESVDNLLAKDGIVEESDLKAIYGAAAKQISSATTETKAKKATKKKKKSFWESLKKGCIGAAEAVVTGAKKVISSAKKCYEEKGWLYDAVQYGKCALKVASGVVKIAGAVATISTGVGVPIAVLSIISAGNDIINACNDAAYVYTDQHDKVGTTNLLKDTLVKNGSEIGKMLGNEKMGEFIGSATYTAIDVVSFLNGADKMLKNFGKTSTVLTGSYKPCSAIWGTQSFDDVANTTIKFDLSLDWFVRKAMKVDGSSVGNILYETGKSVYKTGKSAWDLGEKIADLAGI